jgi:hypothetical protein
MGNSYVGKFQRCLSLRNTIMGNGGSHGPKDKPKETKGETPEKKK